MWRASALHADPGRLSTAELLPPHVALHAQQQVSAPALGPCACAGGRCLCSRGEPGAIPGHSACERRSVGPRAGATAETNCFPLASRALAGARTHGVTVRNARRFFARADATETGHVHGASIF